VSDALLAKLARLDERDRAWLLAELPPRMRNDLANLLGDEVPAPAPPAGFEALEPERVARLLEGEPAWLVSAATRGAESRWRAQLLAAMTSRRRHEIELADRSGAPLAVRARQLVLDGCRARLGGAEPLAHVEPRSRFAELVDSMRSRFA
jgi:hypothetical protein